MIRTAQERFPCENVDAIIKRARSSHRFTDNTFNDYTATRITSLRGLQPEILGYTELTREHFGDLLWKRVEAWA